MPASLDRIRVSVPDHVITRAVGGSTVILDVNSGRSFSLDDAGSRVWTLLTSTGSAKQTLDALKLAFDADPVRLESDVERLIAQLVDAALLERFEIPA